MELNGTLLIILFIFGYISYNVSDAAGDVAIELKKQDPWHRWGAVQVGIFYASLSYNLMGFTWYTLIIFCIAVIVRFPMFTLLHNLFKGDRWDHLSDRGIDGFVKRLWGKIFK